MFIKLSFLVVDIELCNKEIYDNINATTGCWTSYDSTDNVLISVGSAVSDMVYIPQEGVLVIMSFYGALHVWKVEWTGDDIDPVPNVTSEIGHFYYYENDGFSGDDDDAFGIPTNDVGDLPRSMAALYIDEDNTFVYVCGQYNDTVSLSGNLMGKFIFIILTYNYASNILFVTVNILLIVHAF